ncbi:MAG: non-heme iron oxygenase ferredoxin subunit [Pseudomonadota bacterium]
MSTLQKHIVAHVEDLEDEKVIRAEVEGLGEVAIYQLGDSYYATENLCTHGDAALSEGEIMDGKIFCPLHGGSFDIKTGEAVDSPCSIDLEVYPLEVEGGALVLSVPE